MQITKLVRKKEDGTYEATLVLTEEQTQFLVNFALGVLVQNGVATIVEQEADEFDSAAQEQQQEPIKTETVN